MAFGSELKALLPLLPAPPALNADAIAQFLENEFLSGEHTVFAGIRRVPPGHALIIDYALNVQRERYWSMQRRCARCDAGHGAGRRRPSRRCSSR